MTSGNFGVKEGSKGTGGPGMNTKTLVCLACAVGLLAACGGNRPLHRFSSASNGPDAFSVLPQRPLEQPASLSELPTPTPGQSNRADVAPKAELVAALGGRPSRAGIPAADSALITQTQRHGVDPNIRAALFAEDEAYRKRRGRLSNKYFSAYARMALDAYAELDRFRAAGVQTPTAPPQ